MAALAVGVGGFALTCMHPAAAQQADQPAAGGGLEELVVASPPDKPASVELMTSQQGALSGAPTEGGAAVAEPKVPTSGLEGFIEGGFGNHGLRTFGGAVTVPLVKGKLQLSVEGYDMHTGIR